MRAYTVKEIADIVGGELIAGDGGREITEFSTTSKEGDAQTMFVPVIGERVDAHTFIGDAYAHGMRAAFTCRRDVVAQRDQSREAAGSGQEDMAYVYIDLPGEKNPNVTALQRFGAYVRGTFSIPVIGITGSVGKTTTKEMVAAAFEAERRTLKTAGSMNSQVGVPRMMCRIEKEHEIAVIEMGMSMPGEMSRIVRVARPDCAVMTNIGVSHMEQLGSQENIRREKLNIINEFPDGGVLFVNGDDPMLAAVADAWKLARADAEQTKRAAGKENDRERKRGDFAENRLRIKAAEIAACGQGTGIARNNDDVMVHGILMSAATAKRFPHIRVVTFGTGADCDYRAKDIQIVEEEMQYTLCGSMQPEELCVRLAVTGEHNVLNSIAALAAAAHYGIAPGRAAKGLYAYRPIAGRGEKKEAGGMVLIDDTYNASPDSMKAGLDSLMAVKAKRHIAVLADMLELGDISRASHEMVGGYAAQCGADYIVAVGKEAEFYIAGALREPLANSCPVRREDGSVVQMARNPRRRVPALEGSFFADNASALLFLKDFLQPGDAVLFKGSRGMRLEELIKGICAKGAEG